MYINFCSVKVEKKACTQVNIANKENSNHRHRCINSAQVKIADNCMGIIVNNNLLLNLSAVPSREATATVCVFSLCGLICMGLSLSGV